MRGHLGMRLSVADVRGLQVHVIEPLFASSWWQSLDESGGR